MALIFVDGFDHYHPINASMKYGAGLSSGSYSWSATGGRRDGGCISLGICELAKTIFPMENLIMGVAVRFNGEQQAFKQPFIRIYAYSSLQFYLALGTDGTIEVYRGDDYFMSTGVKVLERETWYYIELKARVNSTDGNILIRIDEEDEIYIEPDNTSQGGYYYTNKIVLCNNCNPPTTSFDDFYINTIDDVVNNKFLGDSRVDTLFPAAPGAFTEWTPSSGQNWECIDDPVYDPNDHIDDIAIAGNNDSYFLQTCPDLYRIFGIQLNMFAISQKPGAYTHVWRHVIYIGDERYESDGSYWSSPVYADHLGLLQTTPRGVRWTPTKLRSYEFGLYCEQVPSNSYLRIAQFAIEVLSSCNPSAAEGWPHNFIGLLKESIGSINSIAKDIIHAVNGVE